MLLTLANTYLTRLKPIDMGGINKEDLGNISLNISEIGFTKRTLVIEGKNMSLLFLSLLIANNIYSFDAFVFNKLDLFLNVLDNISSYFWDL